ncbi:Dot/Icm T4SS effector AnkN/AnkX/LegA8 [Legionella resiliens]|uniref:Ankyrin repeat domain-containing protein n=1 Tax=Legionella resiliens TaxID=2905958 RepID=A0ABS8X6H5_9GAMM|nr:MULTISPECIES: Dot/Icm T4SS effector AnkN/AnkX/LegA8 [unclassified Legionella]MCE0724402.1 ankyrin repeat domain-containing protein [Legionella sp. 9fVS26]MCE3533554.1 ankyrin repeat domain-containing protein [Legionella sp. 8cVS16]
MANLPGLFYLKAYPPEEIWRLFVDGRFWSKENGWQGYESRERGSLNAALESLCSIALQVDTAGEGFELSVDLIKEIHKKCGKKVEELQDKNPGEIRTDEPVSFGIPASRASIKGIEEFLGLFFLLEGEAEFGPGQLGPLGYPKFDKNYFKDLSPEQIPELAKKIYKDMSEDGHSNTTHFYLAVQKNVDGFLEAITRSYNKEIKAAHTIDEKLQVIAKHIRYYEVLHPFRDANGRTFVNNLLNILLMQQGLPPATFYEPNVFDLYSADELVVVIKEAIFNTVEVIERSKKDISLYGYSSSLEDRDQFMKMLDSPAYTKIRGNSFLHSDIETLQRDTKDCLASLAALYPLHRGAVYLSDPSDIKELVSMNESQINKRIKQGAPPLYVGKTPMHLAVMMCNSAMVDELIGQKADLSIPDYDGKTVLHYAAESGNIEIMSKILKTLSQQEDALKLLNVQDNQGKTAFHYAAEHGNPELITGLISTGVVQINEPDKRGMSPITLAYKNRKLETFEILLDAGAEISKELLDTVSARKDIETFKKIISKNEKLLLNQDVLRLAIGLGSRSLVGKFLQAGMDINTPLNKDNATPLMLAVGSGNINLVKYLLKKGADTNLTDASGHSPMHYVFFTGPEPREALVKIIAEKNKEVLDKPNKYGRPPIYSTITLQDFKCTQILLDMGAKIDFQDVEGNNMLHTAMGRCPLPVVQEILSRDRTLIHQRNIEGRNPFHQALDSVSFSARFKKENEIKFMDLSDFLIKEKVNLNTKDVNKKTILDIALSKNYYHLCVKLMKEGAHTNISSAARFLEKASSDSIFNYPKTFNKGLMKRLSDDPLIAMAQLNDLYIKIKANDIRTPKDFLPQSGLTFFKGKSEETKAHEQVLSVLKGVYDSKLKELLGKQGEKEGLDKKKPFLDEDLRYLIKHQEISRKIDKPSEQLVEGETYKIKW